MRWGLAVDKDGVPEVGRDGTPTGRMDWIPTGEDGFDGYLKWLGRTKSTAFVALIKSMIPHQLNVRSEKTTDVRYRSFAEVKADLKAAGYSDEKVQYLIEDLLPHNKVSVVNAKPETPVKALAGADGGAGQGDYIDEDGILRNEQTNPRP